VSTPPRNLRRERVMWNSLLVNLRQESGRVTISTEVHSTNKWKTCWDTESVYGLGQNKIHLRSELSAPRLSRSNPEYRYNLRRSPGPHSTLGFPIDAKGTRFNFNCDAFATVWQRVIAKWRCLEQKIPHEPLNCLLRNSNKHICIL
jgi:hypothetical protein